MANDQEINAGIANAQRFKEFLRLVSMLDRNSRRDIEFGTDATLIKALTTNKNKKLHFSVSAATQMVAIRQDYYKYRYSPLIAQQKNPADENKSEEKEKSGETVGSTTVRPTKLPDDNLKAEISTQKKYVDTKLPPGTSEIQNIDEKIQGKLNESTTGIQQQTINKQGFVPMSNAPSGAKPATPAAPGKTTPSTPGKTTPKVPGNKRGLPHLPKPGLPGGITNPVQAIKNLAFFLNPTNIIILSLIGIFISVFFIVLLFGGGGGGGGGTAGGGGGQQPAPPVGGQSTYTFVALGDSLTAWPCYPVDAGCVNSHPWGSYDFTGSPWPTHLAKIDTNLILKHNGGLPAKTSTYIENQFSAQVTPYHPDVLFVLAGTNDAGKGITNPEVTKANIEKIISDAKSVGIKKVILLTIPHQCGGGYTDINNAIKTLASDYSPVIDISGTSVLTCSDFQTSDNLHLTDPGALKVAQYIDDQIKSRGILPTPAPVPPASNFHLYCQYAYKTSACNIYSYGCAPTSMAMVLTTFGDTSTPLDVGTKYGMGCTGSTSYQQIKDALNSLKLGYAVAVIGPRNNNLNPDTLKTYLSKGYYIIAGGCMTGGYSGATGHTTVITSPNTDGTFNDADPTWNSPPSHGCSTDANIHMRTLNITYPGPDLPAGNQCGDPTGAWGGWSWAFAVKKQ